MRKNQNFVRRVFHLVTPLPIKTSTGSGPFGDPHGVETK